MISDCNGAHADSQNIGIHQFSYGRWIKQYHTQYFALHCPSIVGRTWVIKKFFKISLMHFTLAFWHQVATFSNFFVKFHNIKPNVILHFIAVGISNNFRNISWKFCEDSSKGKIPYLYLFTYPTTILSQIFTFASEIFASRFSNFRLPYQKFTLTSQLLHMAN